MSTTNEGKIIQAYTQKKNDGIIGRIEHLYLTDCELVRSIQTYYIFFTSGYLLLSFIWVLLVWHCYHEHSTSLQRGLMALPILKLIQVFTYGIYVGECPWANQMHARYMMMALVTVSTMYQTILIAYILMMSKGWKIVRHSLPRGDLSTFTLLMGSVYMTYSAYYVSINISSMKMFIGVSIYITICLVPSQYSISCTLHDFAERPI